jgi:anaerobic magnesium-protoporphyrin IX monomethyl ester cyclase
MNNGADIDLVSLRFGRDLGKLPPIGSLYLAAAVEAADLRCTLHDCQLNASINAFDVEAFVDLVRTLDAPVLGLSVFNDAIPLVIAGLDRLSCEPAKRRVIIGGPGVVGIAGALMARLPQVEAVVVGEGETALPSLIKGNLAPGSMPGVWTRLDHGAVRGAGRTAREPLDRFSSLPWEWCRNRGYSRVPLSTMRGCPFDCDFCEIIAFMGRKVRMRDLDLSLIDLDTAIDAVGSNEVDVLDDTFTVSRKRVHNFCAALKGRRTPIRFSIYSRVDTIDRPMMEALADAGCQRVFFGIDAADQSVLNRIHKRICIEQALPVLKEAAEYFDVTASLIWGFPFESGEAFDATLAFAETCLDQPGRHRIRPQLHLLSPSSGTPLFEQYGDRMVLDESIEGLMCGTLGVNSFRPHYGVIFKVIRENPLLAAPFHRYETPDFATKARRVERFNRNLDIEIGRSIDALLMEN